MMKNKFLTNLLIAFLSFGGLFSLPKQKEESKIVKAESQYLEVERIEWNNQDYSNTISRKWVKDISAEFAPLYGYCLLASFKGNISSETYVDTNILELDIPNCNVNDHILINGKEIENVPNIEIYCFPQTGFFIYVPASSIELNGDYPYLTIDVLQGMTIDGTGKTTSVSFEYRGIIGSFGKWEINPDKATDINASFYKFEWNNIDYFDAGGGTPWIKERDASNVPTEGYCLLAGFKADNQAYGGENPSSPEGKIFGATYVNTEKRGILGLGYNIDTMVRVNGVNIIDVKDAVCYIYPQYGLYFYIPDSSITFSKEYYSVKLELLEGLKFANVNIRPVTFEFDRDMGTSFGWSVIKDESSLNRIPFTGIASDWNNVSADATHSQSVFIFGTHSVDYLKNDREKDEINQVTKNSSCGNKITINGIPLNQHQDANINYAHQFCYLYFYVSKNALVPSNGYKIVTLHIEEGTIFYDTYLPEVTLYLYNDKWVDVRPETPEDSDYSNALSINDVFKVNEVTLDENSPYLTGEKQANLDSFGFFIDYKLLSNDSGVSLHLLSNGERSGIRIVLKDNLVSLYDATSGNAFLGSANLDLFTYDEWFSLFVYTRIINDSLSIFVAVDDIIYIHVDEVIFNKTENIGSRFDIYLDDGVASFKKATLGEDNKKPILSYSGKSVYGVYENSEVIDFSNKCTAYDTVDKDVTSLIQYNWPEGAISNNKINKGNWNVSIVAYDKSNNKATINVLVIATNKLEVTVTFDGKDATTYRIGDCIACVPDPVKEGNASYEFIGWYYNDRLWDFEKDYVICDMNLESRFVQITKEYKVTVTISGLPDNTGYDLYFIHGTKVDVSIFEREGYSLIAYVNEEVVTSFTVIEDMNIKLVYQVLNPTIEEKGCKGDISSFVTTFPLLGVMLIFFVLNKKKGEQVL